MLLFFCSSSDVDSSIFFMLYLHLLRWFHIFLIHLGIECHWFFSNNGKTTLNFRDKPQLSLNIFSSLFVVQCSLGFSHQHSCVSWLCFSLQYPFGPCYQGDAGVKKFPLISIVFMRSTRVVACVRDRSILWTQDFLFIHSSPDAH